MSNKYIYAILVIFLASNISSADDFFGRGGATPAPVDAEYLVSTADATLTAEDVVTEGTAIDYANGAGTGTFSWDSTEINSTTWGDNSTTPVTWTYDISGATNPAFSIDPSGFGIGTTSPLGSLHVKGIVSGDGIYIERSGTGADTDLRFYQQTPVLRWSYHFDGSSPEDMFIFPAASTQDLNLQVNEVGTVFGNVGIGTNAPTTALHVVGDITITGDNIEATTETDRFVFMANGSTYAPEAIDLTTDTVGNYANGDAEAGNAVSIVNGTNPTVDAAGEIAQDTTDDQLLYGATPRVIPYRFRKCVMFENLVAADDNMLIWNAEKAITVQAVSCRTAGFTTQPTLTFEDGSGNAMTGNPTCNATESQAWTSISGGGAITALESIRFDTTNTPAPTTATQSLICFVYTEDRS